MSSKSSKSDHISSLLHPRCWWGHPNVNKNAYFVHVVHISFGYMSEITQTQKLGVSRWRVTSCATMCPESCLGGVPGEQGCPETWLGGCQNPTYTLPYPMVASFGLRNRDIQDFSACVMSDADALLGWKDFLKSTTGRTTKEQFYWLSEDSQKIDSPKGVLRYFALGLFKMALFSLSVQYGTLSLRGFSIKALKWEKLGPPTHKKAVPFQFADVTCKYYQKNIGQLRHVYIRSLGRFYMLHFISVDLRTWAS